MTARTAEVSPAHLRALSADSGVRIEWPASGSGWAYLRLTTDTYMAWEEAVR